MRDRAEARDAELAVGADAAASRADCPEVGKLRESGGKANERGPLRLNRERASGAADPGASGNPRAPVMPDTACTRAAAATVGTRDDAERDADTQAKVALLNPATSLKEAAPRWGT